MVRMRACRQFLSAAARFRAGVAAPVRWREELVIIILQTGFGIVYANTLVDMRAHLVEGLNKGAQNWATIADTRRRL